MDQKTVITDDLVKAEIKRLAKLQKLDKRISKEELKKSFLSSKLHDLRGKEEALESMPLEEFRSQRNFLKLHLGRFATSTSIALVVSALVVNMMLIAGTMLFGLPAFISLGATVVVAASLAFFGFRKFAVWSFGQKEGDEALFESPEGLLVTCIAGALFSACVMILLSLVQTYLLNENVPPSAWYLILSFVTYALWSAIFCVKVHLDARAEHFAIVKESLKNDNQ